MVGGSACVCQKRVPPREGVEEGKGKDLAAEGWAEGGRECSDGRSSKVYSLVGRECLLRYGEGWLLAPRVVAKAYCRTVRLYGTVEVALSPTSCCHKPLVHARLWAVRRRLLLAISQ